MKIPSNFELDVKGDYYLLSDSENESIKFIGYKKSDFNENQYIKFTVEGYDVYMENREDADFCEVYDNLSTGLTYGKEPIVINGIEKNSIFCIWEMVIWI